MKRYTDVKIGNGDDVDKNLTSTMKINWHY